MEREGPISATATACATSANSIGDSVRMILHGDADAMIAGGAEAAVTPLSVGGFAAMRALSTRNDEPTQASRPFDKDRDGFVIGEGAGILILEELEFAKARGAKILGEVIGYGMSADAYHMTGIAPDGAGAQRSMRAALKDAGIQPEEVGYVNAHATSTPAGDGNESRAIELVFGEHALSHKLKISGTKSMTGHLLGGAGGLEAGITVLALQNQDASADHQSRQCRSGVPAGLCAEQSHHAQFRCGAVEFIWVRRDQRYADHAALDGVESRDTGIREQASGAHLAMCAACVFRRRQRYLVP